MCSPPVPSVIASGKIARLSFRAWTQSKHVTLVCHDIKKINSAVSVKPSVGSPSASLLQTTFSFVQINQRIGEMTFYRNLVWFTKGFREYTKNGYLAAEKSFDPKALDVDVSSRTFMITGANSGIGKDTAAFLAKKGATVHMVCRSETRGEEARKEITETSGSDKVKLHILDMSQPRKVWEFVEKFSSSSEALHVLINNAGCMVNTREVDDNGLEKNFATNTLGTYILTSGLIPLLLKHESPRVITVSSGL